MTIAGQGLNDRSNIPHSPHIANDQRTEDAMNKRKRERDDVDPTLKKRPIKAKYRLDGWVGADKSSDVVET